MKNALKYAVLGLGPIVLIVGLLYSCSGGGDDYNTRNMYNVVTGEKVTVEDPGVIPFPDSQNRRSLYPFKVDETGREVIWPPHYQDRLRTEAESGRFGYTKDSVKVDWETMELRP